MVLRNVEHDTRGGSIASRDRGSCEGVDGVEGTDAPSRMRRWWGPDNHPTPHRCVRNQTTPGHAWPGGRSCDVFVRKARPTETRSARPTSDSLGSADSSPSPTGSRGRGGRALKTRGCGLRRPGGRVARRQGGDHREGEQQSFEHGISSTASADGCRRWSVWGVGGRRSDGPPPTLGRPRRRPCRLGRGWRCSRLAGAPTHRVHCRETSVIRDGRRSRADGSGPPPCSADIDAAPPHRRGVGQHHPTERSPR